MYLCMQIYPVFSKEQDTFIRQRLEEWGDKPRKFDMWLSLSVDLKQTMDAVRSRAKCLEKFSDGCILSCDQQVREEDKSDGEEENQYWDEVGEGEGVDNEDDVHEVQDDEEEDQVGEV